MKTIEQCLILDEGKKNNLYFDHLGYPTIGIGHLIAREKLSKAQAIQRLDQLMKRSTGGVISDIEVSELFKQDLSVVMNSIKKQAFFPIYLKLDQSRQTAIQNMVFNLGAKGVQGFPSMWRALDKGNYEEAARHALDSLWARQVPNRAKRVTNTIRTGGFEGY
ncbi:glycoside hydrolase family protein [Aeromonas sp. QDB03]|uniref:glycoside hydrolase family protein n=1 Tax=Aeromonas sp. QDB03 TaxID=2989839 RepID=UPI0022E5783B|nr:glycoside hydrolase family protein [Aeromonas sp. QDB03]